MGVMGKVIRITPPHLVLAWFGMHDVAMLTG